MTQVVKIDKPIKNYLMDFGLTEKEVKLYLALLKTGPNTIMNLARETGIKRSTTHNNVEELIKKGLVSQTNYGERRMVVAEDPGKLSFLLEQKKWDMKKLEDNMTEIVGMIKGMVPDGSNRNDVDVKYYEGVRGVELVYKELLTASKVFSFVNLDKYYEVFPDTISLFKDALEKNKEREVNSIVIDSPLAKQIKQNAHERYKAKFLSSLDSSSGFEIGTYDEKVAVIQLEKEKPLAIIIHSSTISSTIKTIHKAIWNLI